jgi:hypothetical protein
MTATYIKPFIKPEYKLDPGNLITWGYEDIMTAKAMDSPDTVKYFENKYGQEICQSVLEYQSQRGISTTDIAAQYQKFPEIQFLSTAFSEEFEENMIQQNVIDPKSGFKMGSLLHVGKECMTIPFNKRYECFSSPATVGLFLNFMGPANKQLEKLPNGSKVVLLKSPDEHITDRIGRTSQRRGDRLKNLEKEFKPHSQLWFLPQASGNGTNDKPLLSMMTCLASMILQHPWFYKNFCVVCVSSGFGSNNKDEAYEDGKGFVRFTNGGNDTKKTVIDAEIAAREQGRGLIIIAGRMLTLGVSLPCVNVVALLDDSSSSDLTYQKMFRALTESEGKTIGYVVDVNPIRTLKTLYDYTTIEQDESNSNKAHEPVTITTLTNLYLFDEDRLFVINEDGTRLTADGLHKRLDEYLQKSRKVYKTILAEATANIADVKTLLAEEFGILKDALKRSKPEVLGIVQDLVGLELPSGMERITDAPLDAKVPKPVDKKTAQDEADRLRSLREILLTSMTLLAFFTTETDLPNAFERYKNNDDQLQEIIYKTVVDRGLVTESVDKETIKNVITSSMVKVMTKLMKPYNNMRTQFSEFTGDQRDVVQFIEENLMPKKEQKDARGEVFTPLELVDDMLAHLPEDVWKHPEYKWLDPANGIGNFPVVAFAKLDVGLSEAMPNEAERRKHIVENMLYMCELDSTNVELSKKLLQKMCGDVNCKLNVIQGDFLTLTYDDIKSKFGGVFNVCMGNPPYNPSKIETGSSGNSIWQNFVMKMETLLEPNGYMCVVHPPGWKKPTEDVYKPEKFKGGIFKGQIRQGQVWQYLKTRGSFTYIYTNDQKAKTPEYWPNFPAVDYYVFQKDSNTSPCKTRNVFCGKEYVSEVSLNKQLPYLPCIMTQETVDILDKVISKEGRKLKFKPGVDPRSFNGKIKGEIKYIYDAGVKGPNYAFYTEKADNVDKSKIVINENGGIDGYYAKFIDASEQIGVLHHTMIQVLEPTDDGKYIEGFLNSDIVKFLFLITQYTSGKMTTNEKGVANSITIPPNDVTDYYEFFGIQQYKPFIETLLADYNVFKAPKRKVEEGVAATPRKKGKARNTTRRSSKTDSVSSKN